MEFKTIGRIPVPSTGGNMDAYLTLVAVVLWILACSDGDAVSLAWFRAVLASTAECLKTAVAVIAAWARS